MNTPGLCRVAPRRATVVLTVAAATLMLLPGARGTASAQAAADAHAMHQRHGDPAAYKASLDDPRRDAYQKPDEVIAALDLRPGMVIADIGAGTGYFSVRFARAVGPTGTVVAVDVSRDMVEHLEARAREAGLAQVRVTLAPPDDPGLAPASVDVVFICDVWHHVEQQEAYLAHLQRALKPGGRLVMIDFQKRDLPVGPPVGMKIAREDLVAQLERAGWRVAREHTFLPYQYFLEFTR